MPHSTDPDDLSSGEPGKTSPPTAASGDPIPSTGPPHIYQSEELFRGRREVWIEHGDVRYRLRITTAGKLILTK
ncbi:MAG: hemin uptake protein HemP [Pirellulaceae bacterium]